MFCYLLNVCKHFQINCSKFIKLPSYSNMVLWSWGANSHGQLGQNINNEQVDKPTRVEFEYFDGNVAQISCGGGHSLLRDEDGKLYSCGWNSKLQLATDKELNRFQRTWDLSGIKFINIVCGWDFSCGVTEDLLFVWGSNSHGQLGLPRDPFSVCVTPLRLQVLAKVVSMGLRHTAIINSKAEVWITGCGKFGQLGLGQDILAVDRFTQVTNIGKISHIACGERHTIAWSADENALYVWGNNKHGQLLLNSEKYSKIFTPQKVCIGVKQPVNKLLSGWNNVLLWLEDGSLLTWGRNTYGQNGNSDSIGHKSLIKLPDGRQVKDVALGSEHTICLASDNTLWAWGWNEHSSTGIESEKDIFSPTMVPIETSGTITHIFAGGAHNFIVTDDQVDPHENKEE